MAKLSQIDENSEANEAINALNRASQTAANDGRIQLYPAGGGHGQGWRFLTNGEEVASGSIPQTAHGSKNLQVALRILVAAVEEHGIAD